MHLISQSTFDSGSNPCCSLRCLASRSPAIGPFRDKQFAAASRSDEFCRTCKGQIYVCQRQRTHSTSSALVRKTPISEAHRSSAVIWPPLNSNRAANFSSFMLQLPSTALNSAGSQYLSHTHWLGRIEAPNRAPAWDYPTRKVVADFPSPPTSRLHYLKPHRQLDW